MFNQIKDLYNLKKQAEELQKQMAHEKITATTLDNSISVTINGNQEILDVKILAGGLDTEQIEQGFKQAFNKAQAEIKNVMAQKFKGMM